MQLDIRIDDVQWADFPEPRVLRVMWLNSPKGRFHFVSGTRLVPDDLDDSAIVRHIEREVRTAYEAHRRPSE